MELYDPTCLPPLVIGSKCPGPGYILPYWDEKPDKDFCTENAFCDMIDGDHIGVCLSAQSIGDSCDFCVQARDPYGTVDYWEVPWTPAPFTQCASGLVCTSEGICATESLVCPLSYDDVFGGGGLCD